MPGISKSIGEKRVRFEQQQQPEPQARAVAKPPPKPSPQNQSSINTGNLPSTTRLQTDNDVSGFVQGLLNRARNDITQMPPQPPQKPAPQNQNLSPPDQVKKGAGEKGWASKLFDINGPNVNFNNFEDESYTYVYLHQWINAYKEEYPDVLEKLEFLKPAKLEHATNDELAFSIFRIRTILKFANGTKFYKEMFNQAVKGIEYLSVYAVKNNWTEASLEGLSEDMKDPQVQDALTQFILENIQFVTASSGLKLLVAGVAAVSQRYAKNKSSRKLTPVVMWDAAAGIEVTDKIQQHIDRIKELRLKLRKK